MIGQPYWIIEFIKVIFAYGFTMYVWPLVVFGRHLKGKSRPYKFCFCVCSTLTIANFLVLGLGLVHLLKIQIVWVIFMGVFFVQLWRNLGFNLKWIEDIRLLANHTITLRGMLLKWIKTILGNVRQAIRRWWESTKGHRFEMALLIIVLIYGTCYFSINALELHSYGFGDTYVHHWWIYELRMGNIFPDGVYPEAMHCFVYLFSGIFNLNLWNAVLFTAGAHIHLYLLSAYILFRELFRWKMSALFVLAAFLTVDQLVMNTVFGMSRLSWTVPQEFGLFTVYMIPYALIRYLRSDEKNNKITVKFYKPAYWKEIFSDKYLLIFMLSVSVSIAIHFYSAIIAAFICMVVVGVYIFRVFSNRRFWRLVIAGVLSLMIAGIPMAGALAEGHRLQGSIYWAIAVSQGGEKAWAEGTYDRENKEIISDDDDTAKSDESKEALPLSQRIINKWNALYAGTYIEMYPGSRGALLLYLTIALGLLSVFAAGVGLLVNLIRKLRKITGKPDRLAPTFLAYLFIAATSFVLLVAYNPVPIGLPPLVAGSRVCSTAQMFAAGVYVCFADMVFAAMGFVAKNRLRKALSFAVIIGIYIGVQVLGMFHGFLYYELTRYPVAVELTKEICEKLPKNKYTIVSTTDELYQMREYGYHEELGDFIRNTSKETYTIPTPYVFVFIEKRPIRYAHYSFAHGPSWLAREQYNADICAQADNAHVSQYPEIDHGEISEWAAEQALPSVRKAAALANNLPNRTILESKTYRWYKTFSAMHPDEGIVIYEDDDFICYCIYQNEYSLFTLGVE